MKVYVLTHCASEDNYTPEVFTSKEKAQTTLQFNYDKYTDGGDNSSIFSSEIWEDGMEIIWDDDSYDKFQIFEVDLL